MARSVAVGRGVDLDLRVCAALVPVPASAREDLTGFVSKLVFVFVVY